MIKQRFYQAGVSRIEIERAANRAKVTIHTGRPGMVIGRGRHRSRQAAQRPGEYDRPPDAGKHRGDQNSRDRRPVGGGEYRLRFGEAHFLPQSHASDPAAL